MTDINQINISSKEIEKYVEHFLETWDRDSLIDYAYNCLIKDYLALNKSSLVEEMTEFYGEGWLKRKELEVFK